MGIKKYIKNHCLIKQWFFYCLELVVRIELTTFSLRVRCSAIEPHQQRTFRILAHGGYKVKQKK